MIRAATLAIAIAIPACGGAPAPPPAARPVRVADHVTEEEAAPAAVPVVAPAADGPRADPPPVEPPADAEEAR